MLNGGNGLLDWVHTDAVVSPSKEGKYKARKSAVGHLAKGSNGTPFFPGITAL